MAQNPTPLHSVTTCQWHKIQLHCIVLRPANGTKSNSEKPLFGENHQTMTEKVKLYLNNRPTPASSVRWRYWPRDSTPRKFSVIYIRVPCHQPVVWVSFLGQPTIWTRQILLGFYPSVQITSQLCHTIENYSSLHGKSIAFWIFLSRSYWKLGQNNVAENDGAIFSICRIWPRDVINDVAR
jgi:hypothetical protein